MAALFGLKAQNVQAIGDSSMGMVNVPLFYKPNTPQRRFHRVARDARFALANAGRRGSKTVCGSAEFARRVTRDLARKTARFGPWVPPRGRDPVPFLQYGIVAPTFQMSKEPRMELQRMFGLYDDDGLIKEQRQDEPWNLQGGVILHWLSGDRPERLVGKKLDGLWIEEASRVKPSAWNDSLRPALSDSAAQDKYGGWGLFTSTPIGKNWFWELWAKGNLEAAEELAKIEGRPVSTILDPNFVVLGWTTAENDSLPGLAAEMELARSQMSPAMFRRNYLADFNSFANQLFDLDYASHFADGPPPNPATIEFGRIYLGGDLGISHPSSFTLMCEDNQRRWQEVSTVAGAGIVWDKSEDWDRRDKMPHAELERATWSTQVYRQLTNYVGESWTQVPVYLPHDNPAVKLIFQDRGFNIQNSHQDGMAAVNFFQGLLQSKRLLIRSGELWRGLTNIRAPDPGKRSPKLWIPEDDDTFDSARAALSYPIMMNENPLSVSLSAMGWHSR